jgi:hypothetical protein
MYFNIDKQSNYILGEVRAPLLASDINSTKHPCFLAPIISSSSSRYSTFGCDYLFHIPSEITIWQQKQKYYRQ